MRLCRHLVDSSKLKVSIKAPLIGTHFKIKLENISETTDQSTILFIEDMIVEVVLKIEDITNLRAIKKVHENSCHRTKEGLLHAEKKTII